MGGISSRLRSCQSGVNMIGLGDLRYDTSQVGGTFYDSYANALTLVGGLPVVRASLVIDAGWFAGDQKLTIANVAVNDTPFVPLSGEPTRTCALPPAGIQVIKTAGTGAGPIANPRTVQRTDDDTQFRVQGCMYKYNLDTESLGTLADRPGAYEVSATIDATAVSPPAIFALE